MDILKKMSVPVPEAAFYTGLFLLTLAVTVYRTRRRGGRLPPGPPGYPVIGNLLDLNEEPKTFLRLTELSKIYGDAFTLQMGWKTTVVLNSHSLVHEALVQRPDDYAGRSLTHSLELLSDGGKNIAFGDFTELWKLQRKIAHSAIRRYTSGTLLEQLIQNSMDKVADILHDYQQQPFDPVPLLSLLIDNIICTMCFGKSYEMDDPFLLKMIELVDDANESFGVGLAADYFPLLKYLPATPGARKFQRLDKCLKDYIYDMMAEHKQHPTHGEPTDLTYSMLQLQEQLGQDGIQLEDAHFSNIIADVFLAGTDTSRYTLTWVLCFAAGYQDVQKRLQAEVDSVVGPGGLVGLKHRKSLSYTEAVVYETMRIRPPVPLALPHKTTRNTTIGEYEVPAGTQVLLNIWSLHRDSSYWDDPESFRPERFLDENGRIMPKPNSFLPFGAGRRVCVGESLARTELHLLVAMLMQRFSFLPEPGHEIVYDMKEKGFTCEAKPFKLIAIPRTEKN